MRSNQKKIFTGSVANMKFSYKSIVREPKKDILIPDPKSAKKGQSQQDKSAPIKPKYKFWKAKLDLTYPEGKIQTILFVRDGTKPDDKPKRVNVDTVTELEQYIPWGSKVRMIIMMNKMWAEKNPKDEEIPQKFGLAFKVLSIETTPREKSGSYRDAIANYAFIDDGEEENDNNIDNSGTNTSGQSNKLDSGVADNVDEIEEGEEEGEEEEEGEGEEGEEEGEEGEEGEEDVDEEEPEPEPEPEPVPVAKGKKVTASPPAKQVIKPQGKNVKK
jgi:hypothetical protein